MAICALVAAADGKIDSSERQHVAQPIFTNEALQNFPAADLQRRQPLQHSSAQARGVFGRLGVADLLDICEGAEPKSEWLSVHPATSPGTAPVSALIAGQTPSAPSAPA